MLPIKIPSRKEIIKKVKAEGMKVAAVYPIHYPRELLRSFNIHPMEVWGPPKIDTKKALAHLQSYICSVVQSGLSFLLDGGLKEADLILVPHCCDSLQGLGSLLKDFIKPEQKLLTLYIPRERSETNVSFLSDQLKTIYDELANFTGKKPTQEELYEQIVLEEEIDELIVKFYQAREGLPLSSREFYTILRSREFLPPKDFKSIIQYVLLHSSSGKLQKPGLILSGLLPEPTETLDLIDELGGFVAIDDMACCLRRVYGKGKSQDPLKRMAERIVYGPPDPMKGNSFEERIDFLVKLAELTNTRGIIFYNVKFCEPEHFYHPILKEKLNKSGIKTLILEIDINQPISQQTETRIKAFIEMIKGDV